MKRLRWAVALGMAALLLCSGAAGEEVAQGSKISTLAAVPPRPPGAPTGTQFAHESEKMTGRARQGAAVAEILRGNVPSFVRVLRPIELKGEVGGDVIEATVWVIPDYVAIGSDEDFLRMPLTWPSAAAIARAFDCIPPTPRIVDAIWQQADHHLTPAPLPPGPQMRTSQYYLRHRASIEGERGDLPLDHLIAGHKKDVVLTGRLLQRRNRIAIYGWHRRGGKAIQPLSTVHDARYADYSHGLRLVWERMLVNGEWQSVFDVLADPALAPVLHAEGRIPTARDLLTTAASQVARPSP